jgi:hypothetical protein
MQKVEHSSKMIIPSCILLRQLAPAREGSRRASASNSPNQQRRQSAFLGEVARESCGANAPPPGLGRVADEASR